MEVYIDDMLVKSKKAGDHVKDLTEVFGVLRKYGIKLNPLKFSFGISSGKLLGYIVISRGIEANPEQIEALKEIQPSLTRRQMQSMNEKVAALS